MLAIVILQHMFFTTLTTDVYHEYILSYFPVWNVKQIDDVKSPYVKIYVDSSIK